jgi:hypothetical protein
VDLSRRYVLGSLGFGFVSALVIKTNPLQTESGLKNNGSSGLQEPFRKRDSYLSLAVVANV